jgi:parallel beta-helix repeat protein
MADLVWTNTAATPLNATNLNSVGRRTATKVVGSSTAGWNADYTCDGTADNVQIQAAIDSLGSEGGTVELSEGTFVVATGIVLDSNVTLSGQGPGSTILDCSATTGLFRCVSAEGTEGSAVNLTVNAAEATNVLTMASTTGFAVGDWVKVQSTATVFTGVGIGEIGRILSMTGTTLTLHDPLNDTYNTADTASVRKVNMLSNVSVEGLGVLGPVSALQETLGLYFDRCEHVVVRNCRFDRTHRDGIAFDDTVGWHVSDCHFKDIQFTGLAYGCQIGYATQDGAMLNCSGLRMRHLFSGAGGGRGGLPRRATVSGCTASQMTDAGLDTHVGCEDVNFVGNTILGSDLDGITYEGSRGVIANNTIKNSSGHAITIQNYSTRKPTDVIVANNTIERTPDRGIRIEVISSGITTWKGLTLIGNRIDDAWRGIEVTNATANPVQNVVIQGNSIRNPTDDGIYLQRSSWAIVTGNTVEVPASRRCLFLENCLDSTVTGNVFRATSATGTTGILTSGTCADLELVGNRCLGAATGIGFNTTTTNCVVMGNNVRGCTTPLSLSSGTGHISTTTQTTYNRI